MKNQKGFALMVALLAVVLVSAGTYAVAHRDVLKSYFQAGDKPAQTDQDEPKDKSEDGDISAGQDAKTGDKPTGGQFGTVIDSDLSIKANIAQENPRNLSPENNTKLAADAAMKSVTFRWTALVPKPKESATYRLRVWQLMQGQNGSQAMKSNKPLVEKDVVNSTEVSVSGLYTGPCKPPYLCDFVWQVQAVSGTESNGAVSESSMFSVSEPKVQNGSTGSIRID